MSSEYFGSQEMKTQKEKAVSVKTYSFFLYLLQNKNAIQIQQKRALSAGRSG
jgi:hypothetical protein